MRPIVSVVLFWIVCCVIIAAGSAHAQQSRGFSTSTLTEDGHVDLGFEDVQVTSAVAAATDPACGTCHAPPAAPAPAVPPAPPVPPVPAAPPTKSFTLTLTGAGTGTGRVASDPGGIDCGSACAAIFSASGTVSLRGTPDAGSTFDGFSGDADCADGAVDLTANTNCMATFTLEAMPDPTPDPTPDPAPDPEVGVPTHFRAAALDAEATLSFTPPASGFASAGTRGPATSYLVEVGTAPGVVNLLSRDIGNVTRFTVKAEEGLNFVAVRAVFAEGPGPRSIELAITLPCVAVPGPPETLRATVAGPVVTLTWLDPMQCGATDYLVEVGSGRGANDRRTFSLGNDRASVVFPNVPSGTYFVRVFGTNRYGTGLASNEVEIVVP